MHMSKSKGERTPIYLRLPIDLRDRIAASGVDADAPWRSKSPTAVITELLFERFPPTDATPATSTPASKPKARTRAGAFTRTTKRARATSKPKRKARR